MYCMRHAGSQPLNPGAAHDRLRVFLCHSIADKPRARRLHQRLTSEGYDVWLDEKALFPGQKWEHQIEHAISESDAVLVCISSKSVNREGYVHNEIEQALQAARSKPDDAVFLIPLRFDDVEIPRKLREFQWSDYFRKDGHSVLLRALEHRAATLGFYTPDSAWSVPKNDPLYCALRARIFGQDAAVARIVNLLKAHKSGLTDTNRPAGSLILVGPAGTGKTWTAQSLAAVLHGDESKLIGINSWEYQSERDLAKLTGAPPGYLGHRETHPLLSSEVIQNAQQDETYPAIILFDDLDTGSDYLQAMVKNIINNAILTMGDNRYVDFRRTLVIITCNGARLRREETEKTDMMPDLNSRRPAEGLSIDLLKAVDGIIRYSPLTTEAAISIVGQELEVLAKTCRTLHGVQLSFSPLVAPLLASKCNASRSGVRVLLRTIREYLKEPLAWELGREQWIDGDVLKAAPDRDGSGVAFSKKLIPRTEQS